VKLSPELGPLVLEKKAAFWQLFLYDLYDHIFIFRPLLISECESIYNLSDYMEEFVVDEWIVSKTIITDNLDFILNAAPAGLCAELASSILDKSTLADLKEVASAIEVERNSRANTANVLDNMVKLVVPTQLKNSKDITYHQQISYVVLAEELTGRKLELTSQTLPKNKQGKRLSPEAASILSKEAADKPDFKKDNDILKSI
jgi:hypothetical protein